MTDADLLTPARIQRAHGWLDGLDRHGEWDTCKAALREVPRLRERIAELEYGHPGEGTTVCTCKSYPHTASCGLDERLIALREENKRLRKALFAVQADCNEFVQLVAVAGNHAPSLSKSRLYSAINVIYRRAGEALRERIAELELFAPQRWSPEQERALIQAVHGPGGLNEQAQKRREATEAEKNRVNNSEAENVRLRAALDDYGQHDGNCTAHRDDGECVCGFSEARSQR